MRTAHLYRIPQNGRIALRFRRSEGVFALRPLNKFYNEKKDAVFGEAHHVPLEIVGAPLPPTENAISCRCAEGMTFRFLFSSAFSLLD